MIIGKRLENHVSEILDNIVSLDYSLSYSFLPSLVHFFPTQLKGSLISQILVAKYWVVIEREQIYLGLNDSFYPP